MKRVLCVFLCLLTAFCFVGCKKQTEQLSEKEPPTIELMSRAVTDDYKVAMVDGEGTVWLENADIKSVLIMFKNGENRYLELRFTEDGEKKFKNAVRKNKKGNLSITIDGEALVPTVTANEKTPEYARADSHYDDVVHWFNELT